MYNERMSTILFLSFIFVIFSLSSSAAFAKKTLSLRTNPFQYSDEYTDSESALQYLSARYYNPALQRFISWDTYPLMNRYNYAEGDPIGNEDPSGHDALKTYAAVMDVTIVLGGLADVGAGGFLMANDNKAVGALLSVTGAAGAVNGAADYISVDPGEHFSDDTHIKAAQVASGTQLIAMVGGFAGNAVMSSRLEQAIKDGRRANWLAKSSGPAGALFNLLAIGSFIGSQIPTNNQNAQLAAIYMTYMALTLGLMSGALTGRIEQVRAKGNEAIEMADIFPRDIFADSNPPETRKPLLPGPDSSQAYGATSINSDNSAQQQQRNFGTIDDWIEHSQQQQEVI